MYSPSSYLGDILPYTEKSSVLLKTPNCILCVFGSWWVMTQTVLHNITYKINLRHDSPSYANLPLNYPGGPYM